MRRAFEFEMLLFNDFLYLRQAVAARQISGNLDRTDFQVAQFVLQNVYLAHFQQAGVAIGNEKKQHKDYQRRHAAVFCQKSFLQHASAQESYYRK